MLDRVSLPCWGVEDAEDVEDADEEEDDGITEETALDPSE
jgi:hypothetical protein